MRAASADRRRPWNAPAPRKAVETKQTVKLTVPTVTSTDRTLTSLHSRLSAVVNKIMDYVNVSCELLTSHHISPSGGLTQDRLLEELTQEKGKWELYMFHELAIEEDVLRKLTPPSLENVKGDLGNAVGDFKRISDLVADTQNHVTLALRKAGRREDATLNSKIWQVFTTLNQNIYESFFRHRRCDEQNPKSRAGDVGLEELQKQIRVLETQVSDGKTALKNKELELEHMEKKMVRDVELFKRVEYAAGLEQDLKRAEDIAARLKSDVTARDAAIRELERRIKPPTQRTLEMSPRGRYLQSNSFRNLKEQLEKKPETSDTEEFHLRSDLESFTKERDLLASRDRRDDDPISRFSDVSGSEEQPTRFRAPFKRPSSATPGESRGALSVKELEIELNREREKSRSFFNALKRKEKECDELYDSLGSHNLDSAPQVNEDLTVLRKEKDELTKALTEVRRQEQRQLVEVNKFASAIKALERDKAKGEQDRLKLIREMESLKQTQDRYKDINQSNEDLLRQLKLAIEDKQKLLKVLNQTKIELTKTADGFMKLEKERDLLYQKIDFLTQEKEMLLRKMSSKQNTLQEEFSREKAACHEEIQKVQNRMEAKLEEINNSLNEKEDKLEASKMTFETKLREYEEIIRQASDQTNLCEAELREEKMRNDEAETRAQAAESYSEQLRAEIDTLQFECQKWETDYENMQKKTGHELSSKVKELAHLSDTMRSLVLQSKEKDAAVEQLRYERETFEGENSTLITEIVSLKDQILLLEQQHLDEIQDANSRIEKLQFQLNAEEQSRIQAESSIAGTKETIQTKDQLVEYVKTQLIDARSGMTQTEVQVKRLVSQLEAKDDIIRQHETDLKDFTWHLQESDALLQEKSAAVDHMTEELESKEERIRVLLIALESHEKEVIALTETKAELTFRLTNLQSDALFHAEKSEKAAETHKAEISELRKEIEKLKLNLSNAGKSVENEERLRRSYAELEIKERATAAHFSSLNSQIETLHQSLQDKFGEIADLQERVSMEDGTVEELHKLLGSADAQLSAVEQAQAEQLRLLDQKTEKLEQLTLEKQELESVCAQHDAALSTLLDENTTLKSSINTSVTIHKQELDRSAEELEHLTLEKQELESVCALHATTLAELRDENETLRSSTNRKVAIHKQELDKSAKELEHLKLEKQELESVCAQHATALAELRDENETLRNSMTSDALGIKDQLADAEKRCIAQVQELKKLGQKLGSEEERRKEIERRVNDASEDYERRVRILNQELDRVKASSEEQATELVKRKEVELTEAKREITALSSEADELHEQLREYLAKERDWKNDHREHEDMIAELKKDNSEKTLNLQTATELIEKLQQHNVQLTHDISLRHNEISTANESIQHFTVEVADLRTQIKHLQQGNQRTEEQESLIQSLREALTSTQIRNSSETEDTQRGSDLAQLSALKTEISELNSEIAGLNALLITAQNNEVAAQRNLTAKVAELEQVQKELQDVKSERDSMTTHIIPSEAVETQETTELPALQDSLTRLKEEAAKQIEELRKQLMDQQIEFSEISDNVNGRLEEAEQRRIQAEALAQATRQELEHFHESKSQEAATLSKELESLRLKSKMEKEVHTQVLEEYTQLQKMYDEVKESSERMKQQLQHQAALLKQSKESMDRHKLKGSDSSRSAETLMRKIEDLTAIVEDKDKQLLQFESKFVSMLKELENRRTELAMLKTANESLLGQKDASLQQSGQSETKTHLEQSFTILLQENELASQTIAQLEDKLHQTEAFRDALQTEKDDLLAEMAKRQPETESFEHLKSALSDKEAEITELLQALQEHKTSREVTKSQGMSLDEMVLKSCLEAKVLALDSRMESEFNTFTSKLSELDTKTGRLFSNAMVLVQMYGGKRKETDKQSADNPEDVSAIRHLLSSFQEEVEFSQNRLSTKLEELDDKTRNVLATASLCLRRYGDLKDTSKSLFTSANQEMLQTFVSMDSKLIEVGTKTSTTCAKSLLLISHLSDRNSALEQQIKALQNEIQRGEQQCSQGLETALKAMNLEIQDRLEGVEARVVQMDSRTNALLGKCLRLITNLSERNSAVDQQITALRKTTGEKDLEITELTARNQQYASELQSTHSKLAAALSGLESLASICAVSNKDMDTKFQVLDGKLVRVASRAISLLTNTSQYITDLSARNSDLVQQVKTLQVELEEKLRAVEEVHEVVTEVVEVVEESTTHEEFEALQSLNDELTNRLGKTQSRLAESESKVQRLQHILDDRSRATDTFALIDMMDEAAAAGEAEFRKVNMGVADLSSKLETLATTVLHLFPQYRETLKRSLQNYETSIIPVMSRLEQVCALRVQGLEEKLEGLKTRAQEKIQELRSEINFLKGLNETKGQGTMRGSENTRRPIDGSQHLDDSVEFVSFEPIHRRGSSVNTSLEDIKQAFGSMKLCKRVNYEGQNWCLTMTHDDEPEFYWWKEQELPRAEISSVWPEVEEESLRSQLDSMTLEHKEALEELAKLREDHTLVLDWLTRQGCDMSRLTLEAALIELHSGKSLLSPRPRASLTPISVDSSYDVTILREGESSQFTPKLGTDMMVLPASNDPELDSLLDTISRLTTENQEQAEFIEAYTRQTEKEKDALVSALAELRNASQQGVSIDPKKLPAVTLLTSLLESRLQTRKK